MPKEHHDTNNHPHSLADAHLIDDNEQKRKDRHQHQDISDNAVIEHDDHDKRRWSSRISNELVRRRSSVTDQFPDTPHGWAALLSLLGCVTVVYEIALQRRLTGPPTVYGQVGTKADSTSDSSLLSDIHSKLTASPDSILRRTIRPSLLIGTRGLLSSVAAYLARGPDAMLWSLSGVSNMHLNGSQLPSRSFRQVLTMTQDGAQIALDWELPEPESAPDRADALLNLQRQVMHGPITACNIVVLILHGINNDASFGYIRSLMRACTDRGWLACGFNFRGCGRQPLATPRNYTGAYTGDLRNVVWQIAAKLPVNGKLFIVGHSLGANLVTKYLGEEGLSGTLPSCVAGGVSLGNPMSIRSDRIGPFMSCVMALGAKKGLLDNWSSFRHMHDSYSRTSFRKAFLAPTLAGVDEALAPISPRNEPEYPFAYKIGYENAEAYWNDASSFVQSPHIPVPTMLLLAADDFLVFHSSRARLQFCVNNPNVLVVETKCGGHLGWQESPPDGSANGMLGTSWADVATTDFIAAVVETINERETHSTVSRTGAQALIRSRL
ncbi:hypothetical protein MPSEU_000600800 [Mayamaea pseudoterrestris]|nr:hypothetical protein MPSEU_000600800 [Mayamaea pseudoterrestris]